MFQKEEQVEDSLFNEKQLLQKQQQNVHGMMNEDLLGSQHQSEFIPLKGSGSFRLHDLTPEEERMMQQQYENDQFMRKIDLISSKNMKILTHSQICQRMDQEPHQEKYWEDPSQKTQKYQYKSELQQEFSKLPSEIIYQSLKKPIGVQISCANKQLISIASNLSQDFASVEQKYRQFIQKKQKAILNAHNKKYKHSLNLIQMLQVSFKEKSFYTAPELAQHIAQNFKVKYSNTLITKQLRKMGNYLKNLQASLDEQLVKNARISYLKILASKINKQTSMVYYINQFELEQHDFDYHSKNEEKMQNVIQSKISPNEIFHYDEKEVLFTIICASLEEGITQYMIQDACFSSQDFANFLSMKFQRLNLQQATVHIFVIDMKEIHRSERVQKLRKTLEARNIFIFYLPPLSDEMNLAFHISNNIRNNISIQAIYCLEKKEAVKRMIDTFSNRQLIEEAQIMKEIMMRAAKGEDIQFQ